MSTGSSIYSIGSQNWTWTYQRGWRNGTRWAGTVFVRWVPRG